MGSQPRSISGSRAAATLGVSEFATQRDVWQLIREERDPGWNQRNGYTLPPPPDNASIRWGTAFEDAVTELSERATGAVVVDKEKEFTTVLKNSAMGPSEGGNSGVSAILTCHIDGEYMADGDFFHQRTDRVLHEGKTTSAMSFRRKWGEPCTDHIPASYQAQVQHQMLVTGAKKVIVSALVFPEAPDTWEKNGWSIIRNSNLAGQDEWVLIRQQEGKQIGDAWRPGDWAKILDAMGYFHQYPVNANPAAHAVMLEKYREFWDRFILGDEIPPVENQDDATRLFPEPVGTVVCSDQVERWWLEYAAIGEEIGKSGPGEKRRLQIRGLILDDARTQKKTLDDESTEKLVFMSSDGRKLGSYAKSGFRSA